MNSFYSHQARCTVRWQELPGHGEPLVFIHGLGCASSYEYPRIVCDPQFGSRRAILIDLPGSGYSDKPETFSYQTSAQAKVVIEPARSFSDNVILAVWAQHGRQHRNRSGRAGR